MKTKKTILYIFTIVIAVSVFILCFFLGKNISQQQYLADANNYITVNGTVSYLAFNDEHTGLYIALSDLSEPLDDDTFKVSGANLRILQHNNMEQKITVGTKISLITAPKYFGDGYVFPVAGVVMDGEELLDFETGLQNIQRRNEA